MFLSVRLLSGKLSGLARYLPHIASCRVDPTNQYPALQTSTSRFCVHFRITTTYFEAMPVRQETFKLVPETLATTTGPRPPMTLKAAKKAYREATKVPRISKAEQRRIAAEEIAQQKREHEKECVAAKAKAAREKRLNKDTEERERRKKLGLPEPSRFVRASQPTIQKFVKIGTGGKRSWKEMDDQAEEDEDNEGEMGESDHIDQERPSRKIVALGQLDDDDEFGDFPSLSQGDLPGLFNIPGTHQPCAESPDTCHTLSAEASAESSHCSNPEEQLLQPVMADSFQLGTEAELDTELVESQLLAEAQATLQSHSTALPPAEQTLKKVPAWVKEQGPRKPLQEVSGNMPPPPLPTKLIGAISTASFPAQAKKLLRQTFEAPPPSTQAFLEAHLDDFFPSPSQQVRELLEDIDDMPSNTQIARELDLEQEPRTTRASAPQPQTGDGDVGLEFLSSQDFVLSSQDLRDIDTPSKAAPKLSPRSDSRERDLDLMTSKDCPPRRPKPKPRFFEEKEDDLLHAAIKESLMANRKPPKSSPRRSQGNFRRVKSTKSDYGDDEFGFEGSVMDSELLAVLDQVDKIRS